MKKILFYGLSLVMLAGTSATLTSCIQETEPTNAVTEDQAHGSEKAKETLLWGMPTVLNNQGVVFGDSYHYDWGYGSIMHIRDRMTGDLTRPYASGYDWYARWAYNLYQGPKYIFCQYIWNSYWKFVQAANEMLKAVPDPESASDVEKGYAGAGYAFRAMLYLDMARMYEFLPNDKTKGVNADGNDVTNLTVPIVDEKATEATTRNNPRVTRAKMAEFILSDLDKAEKYIPNLTYTAKTLPHLDAVYGLKARLYMWLEDYTKTAEYAKKAIDEAAKRGVGVMTQEECLSSQKGFNDMSKWMWGDQLVKENSAVQTGIINWASFMCNEQTFGYAQFTPIQIDASMYARIDKNDFRKNMWSPGAMLTKNKDGEYVNYPWYEKYCIAPTNDKAPYGNWGPCVSIKFRPNNGDISDVNTAAATAYPLMRVEEMYFILAEATAHSNPADGKKLLEEFMTTYRDPQYTFPSNKTSKDDIIEEIVFQKRVELWGEGQTFFDIKRLNYSVTRKYDGTNFPASAQFNTNGRPAWMNICIVEREQNNNSALIGWNNPDPSGLYDE